MDGYDQVHLIQHPILAKEVLLLGSLSSLQVANAITAVKLDIDLVVEVGLAVVKTTSLDDDIARHDVEASVEAGAAVATEEVVVYLARGAGDIILLGRAWNTDISACLTKRIG